MNGFSQTVTENKDTTHVVLSTRVARRVAVDLVLGDKAREENKLLVEKVGTLNNIVNVQDSLLLVRSRELKAFADIVELDNLQLKQQSQDITRLNKDIEKQVKVKKGFQIATGVSVIVAIICLLR